MKKVNADFPENFLESVFLTASCSCYYAKTMTTYTVILYVYILNRKYHVYPCIINCVCKLICQ